MTLPMFESRDIVVDDRDTWCTPQEVVDALLRFWPDGPDLDPCTNERSIVPCRRRYTLADCIEPQHQEWRADDRIYCNPPFSDTAPWARRMSMHTGAVVGCVLADPSVSWWRDIWSADAICFPDHRVKFLPPPGAKSTSFDRPIALPLWCSTRDHSREVQLHAFEWAFGSLGKVVHL
ncbi:MAG TPA: DNA N-6-adenine-methyltransferase [Candidatus Limnocylindria bacterium]|nr:DNA N-6-adenine-methyltransferase [Candidatus Limnocylindria bacterium]